MTTTNRPPATHARQIGLAGTLARYLVGAALLASVIEGHVTNGFHPWSWILGLVGFPAAVTAWQRWRAHRHPERFQATGPAAHLLNIGVFLALYLTTWYAPSLEVTSDAALLFYGASMLLAAVRGTAGCEVLTVSNWLLHRDDQIGCALFWPIDHTEASRPPPTAGPRRLPRGVEEMRCP
jgi:hypothetical protein